MNRIFSLACAAAGMATAACGGATPIGEAGSGGNAGAGGDAPGGTGGGSSGTDGTGGKASASGGTGASTSGGTGASASGGAGASANGGTGASTGGGSLPCEILENAGHPCVAAHSTVRALVGGYTGNLYQVERSDQTPLDIGVVDGYADASAQEAFCSGGGCRLTIIYDQSPSGNHLTVAPPGGAKATPANPATIGDLPTNIDGRTVYGIRFRPGEGYRAACNGCAYPAGPLQTATGDAPQTIYVVTSQHDLVNGCCFDYGNAELSRDNDGNGTAEALYFGNGVVWGSGVGQGPWVMADLENGLYAGWENGQDRAISTNTALEYDFVTAVLVGDTFEKNRGQGRFALYGGDATSGALKTMYDGIRPRKPGYVPMQKQGSVILSVAGDNSDGDGGRFYEGVIANGAATKQTVDALQAAIVAAGYGR